MAHADEQFAIEMALASEGCKEVGLGKCRYLPYSERLENARKWIEEAPPESVAWCKKVNAEARKNAATACQ